MQQLEVYVRGVIRGDDFIGYEFDTDEDVFNPETDNECSSFRLEVRQRLTGTELNVFEIGSEDWFVYDDVTHLVDVKQIYADIQKQIADKAPDDFTEEYKKFVAEEERREAEEEAQYSKG